MAKSIKWRGDLQARLNGFDKRNMMKLTLAGAAIAAESEAYMKTNASWQDQTGNARNGLKATVVPGGRLVAVVLYHSVPYGIWLEVRWSGKFAIIMPTVEIMGPRYMALASKMMFGSK